MEYCCWVYPSGTPEQQEERTQFWMVWRENGGTPAYRHYTKQEAVKEAERLARQHPGTTFFVLKATAALVADEPTTRRLKLVSDEIPF